MAKKKNKPCDCITKSENRLRDKMIVDNIDKEGFNITSAHYANQSIFPDQKIYMPFEMRYTVTKKDGSKSQEKIKKFNIFPSYCPICGKPYPKNKK